MSAFKGRKKKEERNQQRQVTTLDPIQLDQYDW